MTPHCLDVHAVAVWNERNAIARSAYQSAPLAASKMMCGHDAFVEYRRGKIGLGQWQERQREVASW